MKSLSNGKRKFIFGSLEYHYDLVMQERKTLSLIVTPDLQICLKCPREANAERIESFLRKKWFWLEKQLSYFRKYQRKIYQKEYVSGEGFLYLGKQYKLVVKKSNHGKVSLTKGLLMVYTPKNVQKGRYTKRLLDAWYKEKAERILSDRYECMKLSFNYKKAPALYIREMHKRWGSFLGSSRIILNPKLIHTPKECIEYVIAHELCHMKYKKHNKQFYAYLNNMYPKWEKVKDKLEAFGVQSA